MKPGVVLDTNVVVSALLKPSGLESQVFRLTLAGRLRLFWSAAILEEYGLVLPRRKLKLQPSEVGRALKEIQKAGIKVHPTRTITECRHEPDNRFLECAESSQAAFLVTGNTKHFPGRWKNTTVVNARELLMQVDLVA